MNKRTYELIGKWVAQQHNIQIVFGNYDTASADVVNNTIHMPLFVNEMHACAALALMIHEAGHLRWTKPEVGPEMLKRCQSEEEKMILNCIEDARIDCKSFELLPNIRDFYKKLYRTNPTVPPDPKMRALINCIMSAELMHEFVHQDTEAKSIASTINEDFTRGVWYLNDKQWAEAYSSIQNIVNTLFTPPPPQGGNNAQPDSNNQGPTDQSQGASQQQDSSGSSNGPSESITKPAGAKEMAQGIEQCLHPTGEIFAKGTLPDDKATPILLQEQTVTMFKELLNVTETQVVDNGNVLDTGELPCYLTGDIETLFKDDTNVKKKRSKLYFLLDRSGSMYQRLFDNARRAEAVIRTMRSLEQILKEVQEIHGVDVAYEIYHFDEELHGPLTDWEAGYVADGGTELLYCLRKLLQITHADYETTGKRMIVVITDGEVHKKEIEEIKQMLTMEAEDVRVMFVPIGGNPGGPFVEIITRGRTIVEQATADQVILETIMEML